MEKDVKKIWDSAGKYKEKAFEPDVDANWQKFKNRIHSAPLEVEATPVRRLVPRYWWAAASIAAIALVSWLVFGQMGADSDIKTFATNSRQIKKWYFQTNPLSGSIAIVKSVLAKTLTAGACAM
ncbi:MAG: hypothetical protein IPO07_09215 [Haliscomenobacter sp.]|nr:hypothetical protein [Haliscomenobacter sp.]MBK9488949.1 hypothetical protein [Haliscomenobacter sp.]